MLSITREECNALSDCVPSNLYIEILTPNMMVLGGGPFGHEGGALVNGISTLIKGAPEEGHHRT